MIGSLAYNLPWTTTFDTEYQYGNLWWDRMSYTFHQVIGEHYLGKPRIIPLHKRNRIAKTRTYRRWHVEPVQLELPLPPPPVPKFSMPSYLPVQYDLPVPSLPWYMDVKHKQWNESVKTLEFEKSVIEELRRFGINRWRDLVYLKPEQLISLVGHTITSQVMLALQRHDFGLWGKIG